MIRRLLAGLALLGLTTSLGLPVAPAARAADPVTVLATDFEDGTWDPWTQNGGGSLSVVDADGDKALLVSNRANDYDGIKAPGNLLQPGGQYTFSMKVKLADGTAGSAGVRFVVEPAGTWVGNTTMTADAWTTVTGTYTAPAGADPTKLRVYVGTGALDAPYGYLVDDIVITGPPAAPPSSKVSAEDFEDGDWSPWTQSGGPTLSVVAADGGGKSLLVENRANDYDGSSRRPGCSSRGSNTRSR